MDQEHFEALYLQEERALFNTVYRWVWNDAEAADLVQEAFVRLWDRRARIDSLAARSYVYRTALNLAASRLRWQRLRQWTGLDGLYGEASPEAALLSGERESAVRAAIEALPDKLRPVVLLVRFATMSYREIAEVLEIPEGTVGSRYNKAMALLTQKLAKLAQGG